MPQITLVSHKHDNNVTVCMISKLFQPSRDILVSLVLADVVDQERANGSTVVSRCDCSVSFLTRSVPDLRLDCFRVYLDASSRKLYANGRLAVKVEFIAREPAEKVGLSDTRVSNQHDW